MPEFIDEKKGEKENEFTEKSGRNTYRLHNACESTGTEAYFVMPTEKPISLTISF